MPEKTPSLSESILSGLSDAITDIRHKVVEEGYFGRVVTDTPAKCPYVNEGLPPSFEDYRASRDAREPEQARQQDRGRELGD
jgi:hypothetical protein